MQERHSCVQIPVMSEHQHCDDNIFQRDRANAEDPRESWDWYQNNMHSGGDLGDIVVVDDVLDDQIVGNDLGGRMEERRNRPFFLSFPSSA